MRGRRDRIQRFEVVAELGAGGMGTVYRARDPSLQRDVAIKVVALGGALPPALSSIRTMDLRTPSAAAHEDLLAEARVMAQVSHPNVLPVFEAGLDGDAVFFVMELVEGSNLRTWLHGRPTRTEVARVFAEAARGLAAAHARGVVHRDFKPDNVLIGSDGRVRVADFGLSLLDRAGDRLIHWGEIAGTPAYMAPEQWHGGMATPCSDVYAFARALGEALTGVRGETAELDELLAAAGVEAELRALLHGGLAEAPEARPALAQFIAALEGRGWPRRRRAIAAAAVAGVVVLAAGGYAMTREDAVAACEAAGAAVGTPRDAARRAALVRAAGEASAALVDRRRGELAAGRHAACSARSAGDTTAAETASWLSCIDRRTAELGAIVRRALSAAHPDPRGTGDRVFGIVDDCRGHTDPPLPADPAPALALLERFMAVPDLPRPQHLAAQQAIERDAAALGERELEARSAFGAGQNLRDADQIKDALAAFERAHRIAAEIHATNTALRALVENANSSSGHGDPAGANRLVALARELTDRPEVTDWNRARVWLAAGRVQEEQGNYLDALASLDRGGALLAHSGRPLVATEIVMRIDKMHALSYLPDRRAEAVAFGRETVDSIEQAQGETQQLAIALEYYATALANVNRIPDGIATGERALAIYRKYLPPTHSFVIDEQIVLASLTSRAGRYADARALYRAVYAVADNNPAVKRSQRASILRGMAVVEFNLGNHAEAMHLFQDALDETIAAFGKDHLRTLLLLVLYADYALDAGRLDEASRRYSAALAGYRKLGDVTPLMLARVEGGVGVRIALARGQSRDAEALARKSLAVLRADPGATAADRIAVEDGLAGALVDQRRWREALEASEVALADARASDPRADLLAVTQLKQARALYELGHRAEGRALARVARDALAGSPGERRANQAAAALVAKLR
ncbi:MAG TPA: protein kinase [Kofleriaceae bacterium]|nr:protein kinase [Kofleriaceae bacterium]